MASKYCSVAFADGTEALMIADSWKEIFYFHPVFPQRGHSHQICYVVNYMHEAVVAAGGSLDEQNVWHTMNLRETLIQNSSHQKACFWCELAKEHLDLQFSEVQLMFLQAREQAEKDNCGDVDFYWIPMAQKFYEDCMESLMPKPAKRK